jgi:adhesin/invasin
LRGIAGELLDPRPELRVTDRGGNPVPGAVVSLKPSSGAVQEREAMTDSLGRVALVWTLGPQAGTQRLIASVPGVERTVGLTTQVRAGPAAKIAIGDLPATALGGEPLPRPVQATVTDAHGNPVPDAMVTFTARLGKVAPARARTDASGRATARWTLATSAGEQRIEVVAKDGGYRASGIVRATAPVKRRK